jgi:hypothetical protein
MWSNGTSPEAPLISQAVIKAVESEITDYSQSPLATLSKETGNYAIKFVNSQWANSYGKKWAPLYISKTPALTWGTATYVTPLKFPLSSALYGRIGLVTSYRPQGWRIFDATRPTAKVAYVNWVKAQPAFHDLLVMTVHSTYANHSLRNKFRKDFRIDCVLFHPDQAAELHTDMQQHVWMAVTDWTKKRDIKEGLSPRLRKARFTVLVDEDFALLELNGLPIQNAERRIEQVTEQIRLQANMNVQGARTDPNLPATVLSLYQQKGYVHIFIEP